MTERSLSEVLQDILEAIADIETFTATIDFETFRQNREKVLAVVKAIEILGEAVKKISEDIRNRQILIKLSKITSIGFFQNFDTKAVKSLAIYFLI